MNKINADKLSLLLKKHSNTAFDFEASVLREERRRYLFTRAILTAFAILIFLAVPAVFFNSAENDRPFIENALYAEAYSQALIASAPSADTSLYWNDFTSELPGDSLEIYSAIYSE